MPKTPLQTPLHQLYDEDFVRWVEATIACLKERDTEQLDWDGLIEEIEDLGKSGIFQIRTIDERPELKPLSLFEKWRTTGSQYLLLGEESGNNRVKVLLFDLKTALTQLEGEYTVDPKRPWYTAHVIVDDIIGHFTGLRGSMASQIAYVSPTREGDELFIIDADGRNARRLTFNKTISMSPQWSFDASRIVYSSLRGNWNIMTINIGTGQNVQVSQWPGLNTTPAWSPVESETIMFTS